MHPTNCLNCGTILTADDNFCPNCGQKTNTHRLTLGHIFHEFFHSFTHADKGFLALLGELAVRPGKVAREYVAGKRKKYFNPFTFFVLILGIFVLANNVFHPHGVPPQPNPNVIRQIPTEEGRQRYLTMMNRSANATKFTQKNGNILAMIALPLFTLITWTFYGRRGYNFAEILVANMLFIAFANLLITLLVYPWLGQVVGKPIYFYAVGGMLLVQVLYIGWAQYQFFRFTQPAAIFLTWFTTLITVVIWSVMTIVFLMMYMFRSDWPRAFKKMWQTIFG